MAIKYAKYAERPAHELHESARMAEKADDLIRVHSWDSWGEFRVSSQGVSIRAWDGRRKETAAEIIVNFERAADHAVNFIFQE